MAASRTGSGPRESTSHNRRGLEAIGNDYGAAKQPRMPSIVVRNSLNLMRISLNMNTQIVERSRFAAEVTLET